MKRVGIYIYRVRDDFSEILEAQIRKLEDYANTHGGVVVDKYFDIGCPHSPKYRFALKQLLSDCSDGKLDEVLILRARHLSERAEVFLQLYNQITDSNVSLCIVEDPVTDEMINLIKIIGALKSKEKLKREELMHAGCETLLHEYGPKKLNKRE